MDHFCQNENVKLYQEIIFSVYCQVYTAIVIKEHTDCTCAVFLKGAHNDLVFECSIMSSLALKDLH